jgi:hypothetical protein
LVDRDELFALPDRTSCASCVDGVDEFVDVKFGDHAKKSITYAEGSSPKELKDLVVKLKALEEKLQNELPGLAQPSDSKVNVADGGIRKGTRSDILRRETARLFCWDYGLCGNKGILGSEEARLRAGLRPPPKLPVHISCRQLSRRLSNAERQEKELNQSDEQARTRHKAGP